MQLNYLQTAKKGTDSQFMGFLYLNIDHVVCNNHSDNPEWGITSAVYHQQSHNMGLHWIFTSEEFSITAVY